MKNASDPGDAPQAGSANSGARNDNSSLFSLASLKLKQPDASHQPKVAEDSGLIDLNALGVIEQGAPPRAPMTVAPMVAPNDIFGSAGTPMLIAPSAAAVSTAAPGTEVAPKKGNGLVIVVGALAAVAIAVGVFAATRGGGATAGATTATATVAPAPPPATATAVAAPEPPTVAAVTPGQRPVAEPTATAAATPPVAKVQGPLPKKAPGGAPPPAKADPPPKPVETCDLACQMQRAVQKK